MKLVRYLGAQPTPRLGILTGEKIIDLQLASEGNLPASMLDFLHQGESAMRTACALSASADEGIAVDSVKLLSPIVNPGKIIAIGLNYRDHIRETGIEMPALATMFCKYSTAIVGPGDPIRWTTTLTRQVDYEAELAVVIGRTAKNVAQADAFDYIAGYTNCNDISARDLQFKAGDQWLRGKCLDSFCPLGPYLVTKDEIPDPHNLRIQCRLNDAVMQDSNTAEMIYRIPYLIEYLSAAFTLQPGDVIITGTPHGVGAFRKPPVWLKNGDHLCVEVEGLGELHNHCIETVD